MAKQIDVRRLADMTAPDRCFLSLYLSAGFDTNWLERKFKAYRDLLEPGEDERENFDHTVAMVNEHLEKHAPSSGSVAVFACWLNDFFEVHPLAVQVEKQVILDSSPYVRPLTEFLDEYETFCIVFLDHRAAQIYLVAGASIAQVDAARGDIKNHVKHGGWSQQRYERRREKQIVHYCKEIARRIEALSKEEHFDRLLITGNKTLIVELQRYLSQDMGNRVAAAKRLQADLSDSTLLQEMFPFFFEEERLAEQRLFERIREECFHGGRSATGPEEVLAALQQGRVDQLLVDRELSLKGHRCRSCETLAAGLPDACAACGGDVFEVDVVNEMVELAAQTSAEVDFSDHIEGLSSWGGIAALLRY